MSLSFFITEFQLALFFKIDLHFSYTSEAEIAYAYIIFNQLFNIRSKISST